MKAIIKRKNLLKSLLICINFNVIFKKFSGGDTSRTPSKDRPSADRQARNARFVKTQQHPSPHQTFLDSPLVVVGLMIIYIKRVLGVKLIIPKTLPKYINLHSSTALIKDFNLSGSQSCNFKSIFRLISLIYPLDLRT